MEPIKLGVLGLDSTHFDAFYNIFLDNRSEIIVKYIQENSEQVLKERIDKYTELSNCVCKSNLETCDAFMVLNRFAEDHLNSFKKILNFKKPVFIDKPISEDLDSTIKIINLAKENQVPITSHSPLEFCTELKDIQKQIENNKKNSIKTLVNLSGPIECNDLGDDPRLKSPLFYGIHITEILSLIIGDKKYKTTSMCLDERSSIFIESDSLRFIVDLYPNGAEFYNLSIYNISEGWMNYNIKLDGSYYSEFYRFLINFFQNKVETNYANKSLNAMKIINEVL